MPGTRPNIAAVVGRTVLPSCIPKSQMRLFLCWTRMIVTTLKARRIAGLPGVRHRCNRLPLQHDEIGRRRVSLCINTHMIYDIRRRIGKWIVENTREAVPACKLLTVWRRPRRHAIHARRTAPRLRCRAMSYGFRSTGALLLPSM